MLAKNKIKNRWLIALSAVGIHICIGSVYAWSVYTKPIQTAMNWSLTEVTATFSIAVFFLGLSAAVMGKFVETKGPRVSSFLATILFGLGTVGSGFAILYESKTLLYLTYGVLGGCGLGIGYIAPVSTLVKWFPEKRGLATGLAIMGFGFASAVSGPAIKLFIDATSISSTFFILGTVYFVVMLISSRYIEPPPSDYLQMGSEKIINKEKINNKDLSNLTRSESIKTLRFYGLWLMLFINVTCGIAIIGVASPLLQEITGITALAAASAIGLMGIFNGFGRIFWASLSDKLTRPVVYVIFFVTQILAFHFLPSATNIIFFQVLLFYVMTCYGGGFASIPAYIGDIFGTKQLGAIHGYILTAWATAGLAGPIIIAYVKEVTGSYTDAIRIFELFFICALIISILMILNIRSIRKKNFQT